METPGVKTPETACNTIIIGAGGAGPSCAKA